MILRFALALALAVSAFSLDASAQRGRGNGGYNGYSGITVYEDPNFRGDSFTFRNEVRDLREEGLNDRISSLEVDGNQAWEVCRDINFGGGCRVFQGTIDDLRSEGWNDRISSMRAVGFARGNSNRGGSGAIREATPTTASRGWCCSIARISAATHEMCRTARPTWEVIASAASRSMAGPGNCARARPAMHAASRSATAFPMCGASGFGTA